MRSTLEAADPPLDLTEWQAHNQNVTHCPQGHEYTTSNTYLMPRGGRVCKTCKNAASRADYWKKRRLALEQAA